MLTNANVPRLIALKSRPRCGPDEFLPLSRPHPCQIDLEEPHKSRVRSPESSQPL